MIESAAYARTHREEAERVIAQYLKLDDPEEAAEAYDFYVVQHFRRVPMPAEQPIRDFLAEQAATDPRAAGARVEEFVDKRFVERAVASGFVDQVYAGQ